MVDRLSVDPLKRVGRGALAVAAAAALVACWPGFAAQAAEGSAGELKKQLLAAKTQGSVTGAIDACTALFDLDTADGVDVLADVGLTRDWPEIESFILNYVESTMKPGAALTHICHLANKHAALQVRITFTLALATRNEEEAYKAVLQSLYDALEPVVKSALEALRRRDELTAVVHLIDALAYHEQKGPAGASLVFETRTLLTELTAKDFELAQDWRTFWTSHESGFKRPPKPKGKRTADDESRTKVAGKGPRFFEQEIVAPRIIFLLDVSGSMSKKDPLPEEPLAEGEKEGKGPRTGVSGKKKEKPPEPKQEDIPLSRMRLKRVQQELIQVLHDLPEYVHFNIITFNHKIGHFKESGLVPASAATKQSAITYVQDFAPEGETHTDEALQAAFDIQEVNTIYLLSDGAPRRGDKPLPFEPIWDWVKINNRFRRIKINTIGFEQEGDNLKKFLKRVALLTRGNYTELK